MRIITTDTEKYYYSYEINTDAAFTPIDSDSDGYYDTWSGKSASILKYKNVTEIKSGETWIPSVTKTLLGTITKLNLATQVDSNILASETQNNVNTELSKQKTALNTIQAQTTQQTINNNNQIKIDTTDLVSATKANSNKSNIDAMTEKLNQMVLESKNIVAELKNNKPIDFNEKFTDIKTAIVDNKLDLTDVNTALNNSAENLLSLKTISDDIAVIKENSDLEKDVLYIENGYYKRLEDGKDKAAREIEIYKNEYENYTKLDVEGNKKIDREIKAHKNLHADIKDENGLTVGHYPLLKDNMYYEKHLEEFTKHVSDSLSDKEIAELNLSDYPFQRLQSDEVILGDNTFHTRTMLEILNVYRVSKGYEPLELVAVDGFDLKVDTKRWNDFKKAAMEGKTANELKTILLS